MQNKKGWMRIIEAFIAILIVTSVFLFVVIKMPPSQEEKEETHSMQRDILRQIEGNNVLREEILSDSESKPQTENFVLNALPYGWDFAIKVCETDDICGMDVYIEKDVYTDEILISSTLHVLQPKKLKLFIWEK